MPRVVGNAKESWEPRAQWTLRPETYRLAELVAEGYDDQVIAQLLHFNHRHVGNMVRSLALHLQVPEGYVIRAYIAKLYWQGKIHCREER